MRLHHGVRLVGRAVGLIELDRRSGKRAGEIAGRRIGGTAEARLRFFRGVFRRCEVEGAVGRNVVDADELRSGARLLECFRNDECNRLMIMLNVRAAEKLRRVARSLLQFSGILCGHDGKHAGRGLGLAQIHPGNAAFGDRRADDITVGLVGDDIVPLVGIWRGAGGLQRTIDAIDGMADDFELIDRVVVAGLSNLMTHILASLSTAGEVRSTSCSLNAFRA